MEYISFSSHSKGYYHVRAGTDCEDCSASYVDPQKRFAIGVICDGHSDKNCFRSGTGARLGCEAMIEIGCRFFELYFEAGSIDFNDLSEPEAVRRLKYSIKCCWDDKVEQDILRAPLTEEEMAPLSERVYNYYKAGKGLNNIYGATFLAVAICDDFFMAFHIGDGEILCINQNGEYYDPLPIDEKNDSGSPASLCDNDLFSRESAFRCVITRDLPIAAVVSSDGIPDCMDSLQYKEIVCSLLTRLKEKESDGTWNSEQFEYLNGYTAHWANEGIGVEDDCSIAGFYHFGKPIPQVVIPLGETINMLLSIVEERNMMINDYENRKKKLAENIAQQSRLVDSLLHDIRRYPAEQKKIDDMLGIFHNMETNEKEKCAYYDRKIETLKSYIKRASGTIPDYRLANMTEIEESVIKSCSVCTVKSSFIESRTQLNNLINERQITINEYEEKKRNKIIEIDSLFQRQAESKTNRETVYQIRCQIRSLQFQVLETIQSESKVNQDYELKIMQMLEKLKSEGISIKAPVTSLPTVDSKYLPDSDEDWTKFKSEMHQDIQQDKELIDNSSCVNVQAITIDETFVSSDTIVENNCLHDDNQNISSIDFIVTENTNDNCQDAKSIIIEAPIVVETENDIQVDNMSSSPVANENDATLEVHSNSDICIASDSINITSEAMAKDDLLSKSNTEIEDSIDSTVPTEKKKGFFGKIKGIFPGNN